MVWWVREDGCGVFCGFMTLMLLVFACFVQLTFVVGPALGYFHPLCILYLIITFLAASSHAKTQFTNPGAVPLNNEELIEIEQPLLQSTDNDMTQSSQNGGESTTTGVNGQSQSIDIVTHKQTDPVSRRKQLNNYFQRNNIHPRFCNACNQYKPNGAHHCSTCERCIIRMDHHCPWVNNCVAMLNQKYFLLFLFYTCLCCVFCLISLTMRFVKCGDYHGKNGGGSSDILGLSRKRRHSKLKSSKKTDNNDRLLLQIDSNDINGYLSNEMIESIDQGRMILSENGNDNINDSLNSNIMSVMDGSNNNEIDAIYGVWCESNGFDVMFCIMNMFEAILFGLFTCIMSCDQVSSILSNTTYIDSLQMRKHGIDKQSINNEKKTSGMNNMAFVFGGNLGWRWLLPLPNTKQIQRDFRHLCAKFD